jgi:hypothetical protein
MDADRFKGTSSQQIELICELHHITGTENGVIVG